MEAARNQIEALKGTLTLQSEVGKGTTFTIRLPWDITITKLLIFRIQQNLFAIPMDTVIPKLKAFEQGKGIRITLGFTFRDTDKGIEVRYVSNGSDADVAGLEKGDVILSFDGEELENSQDLKEKINMYVVGDVVELIVERNGKEKSIEIEFTDGES